MFSNKISFNGGKINRAWSFRLQKQPFAGITALNLPQSLQRGMPKASISSFPVSGLFGVVKPSGPTSMSIVNDLQLLIARSKLFVDAEKLEKIKGKKLDRRRGKAGRESVKVGQGGTLDPLADGVLGVKFDFLLFLCH